VTGAPPRSGLADPVRLNAGPVDLEICGPDLTHIRWCGQEVMRRIYVAVRDETWNTVVPELLGFRVESRPGSFVVRVDVRHRDGAIDFEWHGTIKGTADGSLDYLMRGKALSAFRYGRIGLCVLHAASDYAGKPFVAQSGQSATRGVLPVDIAPQRYHDGIYEPIVSEFDALHVQLSRDLRVDFAFEGDQFEIEDQRNWTDASFKTYSTPLRLGYPHHAAAGQRFRQHVTVGVVGNRPRAAPPRGRPATTIVTVGDSTGRGLPAVGTSVPSDTAGQMSPQARALLRKLGLAHVRVDVHAGSDDARTVLERGVALARSANAALELALYVNGASARLSADLVRLVPADVPLARVLVLDEAKEVTQPATARVVREGLRAMGLSAPVGGGTAHWFAELNRNPPDPSVLDFVAYGLCPQLHVFDDAALMETLAVQGMTVALARGRGGRPVVIGPVMLMPRAGGAAGTGTPIGEGIDPRQRSLLCAAWTLGSLTQLSRAGAESVTYFEALGPRGLIEADASEGRGGACPAGASPYPVHQMLVEAGRLSGGDVRETESSEPLAADALACSDGTRLCVLVANLRPHPQRVMIEGLPQVMATIRATRLPSKPSATEYSGPLTSVTRRAATRGRLPLTLGAYGFARIAVPDRALATIRESGSHYEGTQGASGTRT
jgi:D-apionolactonase